MHAGAHPRAPLAAAQVSRWCASAHPRALPAATQVLTRDCHAEIFAPFLQDFLLKPIPIAMYSNYKTLIGISVLHKIVCLYAQVHVLSQVI